MLNCKSRMSSHITFPIKVYCTDHKWLLWNILSNTAVTKITWIETLTFLSATQGICILYLFSYLLSFLGSQDTVLLFKNHYLSSIVQLVYCSMQLVPKCIYNVILFIKKIQMIYYLKLVTVCFKTIILYLSLITKHCLALCIQNCVHTRIFIFRL